VISNWRDAWFGILRNTVHGNVYALETSDWRPTNSVIPTRQTNRPGDGPRAGWSERAGTPMLGGDCGAARASALRASHASGRRFETRRAHWETHCYSAGPAASMACSSEENICHRAIKPSRTVNTSTASASIGAPLATPRPR
jgi:hypothetical protein